eukprot:SAG31_NODE_27852_length_419_cov_0.734375_1_plen_135_part_01
MQAIRTQLSCTSRAPATALDVYAPGLCSAQWNGKVRPAIAQRTRSVALETPPQQRCLLVPLPVRRSLLGEHPRETQGQSGARPRLTHCTEVEGDALEANAARHQHEPNDCAVGKRLHRPRRAGAAPRGSVATVRR